MLPLRKLKPSVGFQSPLGESPPAEVEWAGLVGESRDATLSSVVLEVLVAVEPTSCGRRMHGWIKKHAHTMRGH